MPAHAEQSGNSRRYPATDLLQEKLARDLHEVISRLAKLYPFLEHTSARAGTFIFVDNSFLNQPCTARTPLSCGESVRPARESSSLKITSARLAASA